MPKTLQINPNRCIGCLNCELACASRDWGTVLPLALPDQPGVFPGRGPGSGELLPMRFRPLPGRLPRGGLDTGRGRRSGDHRSRTLPRLPGLRLGLPLRQHQLCPGRPPGRQVRPLPGRAPLRGGLSLQGPGISGRGRGGAPKEAGFRGRRPGRLQGPLIAVTINKAWPRAVVNNRP